ncbi:hypothetical protein AWB67_02218 [Caballeronia terrestris]|uniref:Uncharacterized protein n=1 Tax=Caballeronia terrestris TaxID=1226301 RepID=A0A158HY22_9BURK|nr:hypothetical protein AWB67_02218 [Caballeronia terrestris]
MPGGDNGFVRSCCLTKECYPTDCCRFVFLPPFFLGLPGAQRPAPPVFNFSRGVHASADASVALRWLPKTISLTCSARHALTRRCSVRNCALFAYASGIIVASRSINCLAGTVGSATSHPSITGHASANGSTRLLHQCFALGYFRCVGRASPSLHAAVRLVRNTAMSDSSAGAASARMPWAANSLNIC